LVKKSRSDALIEFQEISGSESLPSFHAYIGKNNNRYVDSVRMQFANPDDFIARWLDGLKKELERLIALGRIGKYLRKIGEELIVESLKNELLKEYIFKFLEAV
jgi:hypothetical protein